MPAPGGDQPVVGQIGISVDRSTTLYIGFSGGNGVEVLYGEEGGQPQTPLKQGVSTFNYQPPNQFNLQYTIKPGGSGFKLAWGYNL
jgi:hypothetical protein